MDGSPASTLLEYMGPCHLWALKTYRLCAHRCVYCNTWAQGISRPVVPLPEVIDVLRRELARVPPDSRIVIGPPTDGYPPAEAHYGVTRAVVTELLRQGRAIGIVTKGTAVMRDAALLAAAGDRACVHVSLSALDDAMLRRLESGAPSAHARLTLIRRLRAARVAVQVGAAPWIPGVSDARALLAAVPSDVIVQFGPLDLAQLPVDDPLGIGRRFTQAKIDADYLKERRRVGADARARWLYPIARGRDIMSYMPPLGGRGRRPHAGLKGKRRGAHWRRGSSSPVLR